MSNNDNIRDLLNEENHDKYYKWKKLPPVETYLKKLLSFCHKCGIDFGGYKSVLTHWTNDHREEEPKFQCKFSICEYVCHKGDQVRSDNPEAFILILDQSQLKDHINNHLLNAGRHTKCPMCGKVFNKAKLTPHIKQVSSDESHPCQSGSFNLSDRRCIQRSRRQSSVRNVGKDSKKRGT